MYVYVQCIAIEYVQCIYIATCIYSVYSYMYVSYNSQCIATCVYYSYMYIQCIATCVYYSYMYISYNSIIYSHTYTVTKSLCCYEQN